MRKMKSGKENHRTKELFTIWIFGILIWCMFLAGLVNYGIRYLNQHYAQVTGVVINRCLQDDGWYAFCQYEFGKITYETKCPSSSDVKVGDTIKMHINTQTKGLVSSREKFALQICICSVVLMVLFALLGIFGLVHFARVHFAQLQKRAAEQFSPSTVCTPQQDGI